MRQAAKEDEQYQSEVERVEKGLSARGSEVREGLIIDYVGRVIVPENTLLKAKLVLEAHEPLFCGYFGVKKTTEIVSRN